MFQFSVEYLEGMQSVAEEFGQFMYCIQCACIQKCTYMKAKKHNNTDNKPWSHKTYLTWTMNNGHARVSDAQNV